MALMYLLVKLQATISKKLVSPSGKQSLAFELYETQDIHRGNHYSITKQQV